MPIFSVLKLLHGLEHNDEETIKLLAQNTIYLVPVVNVDGLADIEETFLKTGEVGMRRKNMNFTGGENCDGGLTSQRGVDLNRNYAVYWDKPGGNSPDPCAENYRGPYPFSEPETRAIRDFLIAHQLDIKFVYNFHSFGNMYLWPYNGSSPNDIEYKNPGILDVFNELYSEATFPVGTIRGNAWDALHYTSSGEQSDWILGTLGIPSICPEIGSSDYFSYQWNIPFRKVVYNVMTENLNWLENTYSKIGNQIEVEPLYWKHLGGCDAQLFFSLKNKGLTDQLSPVKVHLTSQNLITKTNDFEVHGIKKRGQ
jgi:hypothetical protein